uniref:Carbonic anhydrase n=1 Tax=Ditylenchus dipsaci TaxID=166011 RepID=A0A915CZV5_9BILA
MTGEQSSTSTNCCISPAMMMSTKQEQKTPAPVDKPTTVKDWGYSQDDCGPTIGLCPQLLQQSPVDLQLTGEMVNTGHSVQFIPEAKIDAAEIYGGQLDQHYRFIQYHYHWSQSDNEGSEHTLCGKSFPAELHLVHQGVEDPSKLAVVGVFLQLEDKEAKALEADAKALPHIQQFNKKVAVQGQQLQCKLPHNLASFVRYQGSLTTPPCSENVTWTVFTEPVAVSKQQLDLLRSIKDCNGVSSTRTVDHYNNSTRETFSAW